MSSIRQLWYALAIVGLLGSVSVFLGAVYGDAGIEVDSMNATGDTPTNASANCDGAVVRTVAVSVTVSRSGVRPDNPQFWKAGMRVRATVFDAVEQRTVALAPGSRATVTLSFTEVRDRSWAPSERAGVVVQVTKGGTELAKRNLSVAFRPVTAGENC